MPVAFEDTSVTPSVIRYYSYEATEAQVLVNGVWKNLSDAGYTVTYRVNGTDRVIEITNTHLSALPEAGGRGVWPLVVLALALMAGGALWYRRRRAMRARRSGSGLRRRA